MGGLLPTKQNKPMQRQDAGVKVVGCLGFKALEQLDRCAQMFRILLAREAWRHQPALPIHGA